VSAGNYLTQRREGAKKNNLTHRHKDGVTLCGRRLLPRAIMKMRFAPISHRGIWESRHLCIFV
jgi:hypothetical protein